MSCLFFGLRNMPHCVATWYTQVYKQHKGHKLDRILSLTESKEKTFNGGN